MKRILTTSLALSVLLLPACKSGKDVEAIKLVPDAAEFVVGVSPKQISSSELYQKYSKHLEGAADYEDFVGAFKDCGLDPFAIESVIVGATQAGDAVVVVAGEGVGKQTEALCVLNKMLEETGQEPVSKVEKDKRKQFIQFSDGRAYLVNDNLLAVALNDWQASIAELIDGEGTAAVDGSKKDSMAKVDTKKPIWVVASVPSEYTSAAADFAPEVTEVKSVVATIDFSQGVAVELIAGFEAEDKATAAADRAKSGIELGKGQLANFGAPPELTTLLEGVKVEASGTDVNVSASATLAELEFVDKFLP